MTAEHRTAGGRSWVQVSINEDWAADEDGEMRSWFPLDPDEADRLGDAVHTSARVARIAQNLKR